MHYEVELAVVIGKTLKDLDPEDEQGALDAIDSAFIFPAAAPVPNAETNAPKATCLAST